MKKLEMNQMENLHGGKCRWWQVIIGGLVFLSAPWTGGIGIAAGMAIGATSGCLFRDEAEGDDSCETC
jgi:predicted phage tail protein